MKKESIFSNKTFLIVLSVIIAFVSWVVVSLDSNDTKGRTISGLSIDMDQVDDTISELGLSVISSDDTRVAVRVEGVTYAILIMNLLVPYINALTRHRPLGVGGGKK